ncbi:MAG: MMPL family transporter [Candidatus Manganitrophus sp. SA1]|nr:MMPL family transporter [Candidatus Manganitrophus morganii]
MMKRYVEKIVGHPYLVIFSVLLITLFFFTQFRNLQMMFDPKSILPQNHPYVQLNNKIEEAFGGSRVVVIGIHNKKGDVFNPATLSKVKGITDDVKKIAGIKEENVVSIADRKIKYVVGTEDQIKITQLMDGEVPTTSEGLSELKKRVYSNDLFLNSLVSKDGTAAAVIVDFGPIVPGEWEGEGGAAGAASGGENWQQWQKGEGSVSTGEPKQSQAAPQQTAEKEEGWKKWQGNESNSACGAWQKSEPGKWLADSLIHCQLQDITAKYSDADHQIYLGGMPIVLSYFEADSFRMLAVLFPIAILIIGILHYIAFRTWQGLFIPLVTSLLAVAWAMGMMGLTRTPLDPWNAMTPILILAIAAGHSVQILKRYYEEYERLGDSKQAVIESTTQVGLAMVTAGVIASASFASLITFKLKTFQSFGLFTAFGILSALVLELTFIPAIRSVLRPSRKKRVVRGPDLLDRFLSSLASQVTGSGRTIILTGAALFFVVSVIGTLRVQVSNSNRSQFFESTLLRQDERALNEKFAGTSTFYILLEAQKEGALKNPNVAQAVDRLQRRLESVPEVGKTESYVDYVKQMNQTLNGGDPAFNKVPDAQDQIAQFLFLYSVSGNPADFARLMRPQQEEAVIWVFLKSDDTRLAEELIQIVEQARDADFTPHQVSLGVAGSSPVVVALNEEMIRGKALNIIQIAAITFLMTALVRRSLLGGFFVIIPLALSVLINFGIMGLSGITLGIGTAAITAMAVGIGADYEIYLIFRLREEFKKSKNIEEAIRTTLQTSGKAIIFVAIAVSAGYGLLAFTGFYLHMEGILVPLAMLTSSLGALTILPALVIIFKPKFVFDGQEVPLALKPTVK